MSGLVKENIAKSARATGAAILLERLEKLIDLAEHVQTLSGEKLRQFVVGSPSCAETDKKETSVTTAVYFDECLIRVSQTELKLKGILALLEDLDL